MKYKIFSFIDFLFSKFEDIYLFTFKMQTMAEYLLILKKESTEINLKLI